MRFTKCDRLCITTYYLHLIFSNCLHRVQVYYFYMRCLPATEMMVWNLATICKGTSPKIDILLKESLLVCVAIMHYGKRRWNTQMNSLLIIHLRLKKLWIYLYGKIFIYTFIICYLIIYVTWAVMPSSSKPNWSGLVQLAD